PTPHGAHPTKRQGKWPRRRREPPPCLVVTVGHRWASAPPWSRRPRAGQGGGKVGTTCPHLALPGRGRGICCPSPHSGPRSIPPDMGERAIWAWVSEGAPVSGCGRFRLTDLREPSGRFTLRTADCPHQISEPVSSLCRRMTSSFPSSPSAWGADAREP